MALGLFPPNRNGFSWVRGTSGVNRSPHELQPYSTTDHGRPCCCPHSQPCIFTVTQRDGWEPRTALGPGPCSRAAWTPRRASGTLPGPGPHTPATPSRWALGTFPQFHHHRHTTANDSAPHGPFLQASPRLRVCCGRLPGGAPVLDGRHRTAWAATASKRERSGGRAPREAPSTVPLRPVFTHVSLTPRPHANGRQAPRRARHKGAPKARTPSPPPWEEMVRAGLLGWACEVPPTRVLFLRAAGRPREVRVQRSGAGWGGPCGPPAAEPQGGPGRPRARGPRGKPRQSEADGDTQGREGKMQADTGLWGLKPRDAWGPWTLTGRDCALMPSRWQGPADTRRPVLPGKCRSRLQGHREES